MADVSSTGGGGLVPISTDELHKLTIAIKDSGGGLAIPMPFVREIFLIECRIAGTTHVEDIDQKTASLAEGSVLKFMREADNKFDSLAIQILNEQNERIGYVPREKNEVLARLMDGGKLVFGQVQSKEQVGDWLKIVIKVFLKDV